MINMTPVMINGVIEFAADAPIAWGSIAEDCELILDNPEARDATDPTEIVQMFERFYGVTIDTD